MLRLGLVVVSHGARRVRQAQPAALRAVVDDVQLRRLVPLLAGLAGPRGVPARSRSYTSAAFPRTIRVPRPSPRLLVGEQSLSYVRRPGRGVPADYPRSAAVAAITRRRTVSFVPPRPGRGVPADYPRSAAVAAITRRRRVSFVPPRPGRGVPADYPRPLAAASPRFWSETRQTYAVQS